MAHAYIDAVARAGADAVKFQTHLAAAESTPAEPWRVRFSYQDNSRYEYWERMEFTEQQWKGLRQHADDAGVGFLSSPFSVEAVELLERVGVAAWKVASGEVTNDLLIERMLESRAPVVLSSGMSTMGEIDHAVALIRRAGVAFALLQCTSQYPTPAERVGLNMLGVFRDRYGCLVGLSDHTGTPHAGVAAAALGLDVLEVHAVFSKEMFGPDAPASVDLAGLRSLVEGVRFVESAYANPVDKDAVAAEMGEMRSLFTKSVVARTDLVAGTVLTAAHLAVKKPGSGLPPGRLAEVVGRTLRSDLRADEMLRAGDVEPALGPGA